MNTLLLGFLLLPSQAAAVELTWEGYYRARGLVYDSLSLSSTNALAEGTSSTLDHRLLVAPTWHVAPNAAIHTQLDVLPLLSWGNEADVYTDPVTGEQLATASADGVAVANPGIYAVRAWGEFNLDIKGVPLNVAMGRMPMHWGSGILWNNGDDPLSEYGDTADRVSLATRFGPVFVGAMWDVQFEGFEGVSDDMQSASLILGYRTETLGLGLLNNYRYQPGLGYQAYTADLWGFAQLGPAYAELEAIGVFGAGDLDNGANDVVIGAYGVMARGGYRTGKISLDAEFGVASGDADPTDQKLKTFSFDRDHNVGILLFEEPLPTLESSVINDTNGGRTTEAAVTGDGISNAIYFRPSVSYQVVPQFSAGLSWVIATQAKPADDTTVGSGYGNEFDLNLRVDPIPHVWFTGSVGLLLPGAYYRDYEDEELGSGFDKAAVGARVVGTIEF